MEETKLLLTVASVMARTSLGRTKIYQLIGTGEIPTCRIGRALRIPAKALEKWVEKQQNQAKLS